MARSESKPRYIALTDIYHGFEVDDIESMVRLMLYSNEFDIEGLIPVTSVWLKEGAKEGNRQIILDIIDAYAEAKVNLDRHAKGYPDPDDLRRVTVAGIPRYGKKEGDGWGETWMNDNPGVNRIIEAVDKDDPRPVWVGLWGGANTLAHAVWKVWKTRSTAEFNRFLSKLRIYGISDQDHSSHWLRQHFGDRLFYIVSPSPANRILSFLYYSRATWSGICECLSFKDVVARYRTGTVAENPKLTSQGGDRDLVSYKWLQENICSHGPLGERYPLYSARMEGDSPTYLYLLPNGLAEPECPNYGSWGGRYGRYIPSLLSAGTREKHPIWCTVSDTVRGQDGKSHTSPQATIWRWREAYQNDFAARMDWSITSSYQKANHPPVVKLDHEAHITAKGGTTVDLNASGTYDPDGSDLTYEWMHYPEAGNSGGEVTVEGKNAPKAGFTAPVVKKPTEIHIILVVKNNGTPPLFGYQRVVVSIMP